MNGAVRFDENDLKASPPVTGGESLRSLRISDAQNLVQSLDGVAKLKSIDDVVSIAGGVRNGGDISIDSSIAGSVRIANILPLSPDGDDSRGVVDIGVTLSQGSGEPVVRYDYLFLGGSARQSVKQEGNDKRVASLIMERMTESLVVAEKSGFAAAETEASGGASSTLKGYRLWPQFGFDGEFDHSESNLKDFLLNASYLHEDNPEVFEWATDLHDTIEGGGAVTVQQIISNRIGEKWWDENGSDINLDIDFRDKESLGYKRFEKMKSLLGRLKDRNKSRSAEDWLLDLEFRDDCGRQDGGKFGPGNDCASEDGSGSGDSSPKSFPKSFPPAAKKFRDAVDSVSPDPEKVWDRSKGKADTPPERVLAQAADEQETSGQTMTPEAEASYADLVDEIGKQYEALVAAGLQVRAWRGEGEPYGDPPGSTKPNSDKMREEVARTGEFSFFMTEKGFGTGAATPDHPMLRETKYKTADGEPMIANDLFRVVHDMVAHVRGGYSFSTNGEYNGMLTHASTLPESAWPALFAETFGQNAVYEKTGNFAAQNAYASKIGPEIIRSELAKRKSSRADDPAKDSDEPLGYQHLKVRPWLMNGAAESRAADCGRDESGKFGPKNQCQDDGSGGGGATAQTQASPDDGIWSSNRNASWEQGSDDPPFDGADRFKSVSVAAPQKVSESLDEFGVTASDAASLVSSLENGNVSIRPAPEFKRGGAFGDSRATPILFAFDGDVAGVKGAIEGSSALGLRREPDGSESLHLYQSTITVSNEVRQDATKRHAAARAFYTAMVNSVENARRIGVTKVTMNASGEADPQVRDHAPFGKGYTIWPRMGFDAPIPPDISRKLPSSLSHAKSLLDLHATPEGTRWWAKNGVDVDVSLDLTDPSSPQNQVFDRFVRKFSTNRREMPLGSGDDWLSPEDILRLDELWSEVWDDGLLDDYEWVEK